MKRILTYILLMLWMLVSCETPQLSDVPVPEGSVTGEVTVSFNVDMPCDVETKARGDEPSTDMDRLYLIVFDENGYYVETCEAELSPTATSGMRTYEVTLHKTDKLRIIHFIAVSNESEDLLLSQIRYGHETEVIGNMYVENNEAAYWYRMTVWYVMTEKDANGQEVLVDEIKDAFTNIPLLRNYASIKVEENLSNFELLQYAIYNTIDKGTIAPYCTEHHIFQSFFNTDTDGKRTLLTYDQHLKAGHEFRGHTLFDVQLKTTLTDNEFISKDLPWYMYERRISVRTDEEHKWSESPAHIIIKGRYNNGPVSYYKIDMVRPVAIDENTTRTEYYNILRNFQYIFTITSIAGDGYSSLAEAMSKPAGNNLAGATDTQGFTNVSDGLGRIFVSHTDTTLTSSGNIKLKYKYIPSVDNGVVDNTKVSISGIFDGTGSVLKSVKSKTDNVGDGWAEVVFEVQEVGAISHIQEITLDVKDNVNLHKTKRYRLQKPYEMTVDCTPNRVNAKAGMPMTVLLRIPDHLPDNIFPLDFMIESDKLTLSPDAAKNNNVMPVEPGLSIVPDKQGKNSFQYIKSIETYEDYKTLRVVGGERVIPTYWLTNKADNAATVYALNKYFKISSDQFTNADELFYDLSFPDGVMAQIGHDNVFSFYINQITPVTVTLSGLTYVNGNGEEVSTFTYTPSRVGYQELTLKTKTTTEAVEVKLSAVYNGHQYDASKSDEPTSTIKIPELTVTFKYRHNYSPSLNDNTVTPVLSVNGRTITPDGIKRSRTGTSTNYTYTVVFTGIQITADDMDNNMDVLFDYTNSQGNRYVYKASAPVSELLTNPYMTMRCYGSNGDALHGCD